MNSSMLKLMKAKKKRPVDPNAPPRPNLLTHEKTLKDTKLTLTQMSDQIRDLERRLAETESRLRHQTQYLSQLHAHLAQQTPRRK
jgi:TolA-binding protein